MMTHPRLTGLFLLLVALGLFLTLDLDHSGGILRLCGFLLSFVGGWLVLIFFWNDGDIAQLRRNNREITLRRAIPGMPVRESTFRYPAMKGARRIVMVCLCMFMLGMAAATFYLAFISERGEADAVTVEIVYFAFGLFLACGLYFCWITWRYGRLFITVDSTGITASTYLGMRSAGWGEIIALRDWIPLRGAGSLSNMFSTDYTLYKVYTKKFIISLPSGLLNANQLVSLISEATGLDWT